MNPLGEKVGYGISLGVKAKTAPRKDADNAYLIKRTLGGQKMKGIEFILLAIGAVVGAYSRYRIVESPITLGGLSVNVLIVNVLGSFILGVFSVLTIALNLDEKYALLVAIGFCGSFTTMSSFALETSNLMDSNRFSLVVLNIIANVGLSLSAIFAGSELGNLVMERILR